MAQADSVPSLNHVPNPDAPAQQSTTSPRRISVADRRYFIGGSDARVIMGNDEPALLRLWREKRGEVEPEDLSGNLIVQLGLATEDLNRRWYQANTGQVLTDVQRQIRHPVLRTSLSQPNASSGAASRAASPLASSGSNHRRPGSRQSELST